MDLFVFSSVCNARSLDHQVFFLLFFFYKVRHVKQGKWLVPVFEKRFRWVRVFWQKSYPLRYICFFAWTRKCQRSFSFSQNQRLGKIWFLIYSPKFSRLIRMKESLDYNFSQISWKNNSWLLQVSVIRHVWTCQNDDK